MTKVRSDRAGIESRQCDFRASAGDSSGHSGTIHWPGALSNLPGWSPRAARVLRERSVALLLLVKIKTDCPPVSVNLNKTLTKLLFLES